MCNKHVSKDVKELTGTYILGKWWLKTKNEYKNKKENRTRWSAFCNLKTPCQTKMCHWDWRRRHLQFVLPTMTYGCETWSLSNTQLKKLTTTQGQMERITVGVTLKDRKHTNWIFKESGVTDVIRNNKKQSHMDGTPGEETWQHMDNQSHWMDTSRT